MEIWTWWGLQGKERLPFKFRRCLALREQKREEGESGERGGRGRERRRMKELPWAGWGGKARGTNTAITGPWGLLDQSPKQQQRWTYYSLLEWVELVTWVITAWGTWQGARWSQVPQPESCQSQCSFQGAMEGVWLNSDCGVRSEAAGPCSNKGFWIVSPESFQKEPYKHLNTTW